MVRRMKYYSVKEIGDKLGVTRQRVDQLIREGKILYERVGNVRIISDESLKLIKKQRSK